MDDERELKIALLEEKLAIWEHDLQNSKHIVVDAEKAQKAIAELKAEIAQLQSN